MPRPPLARMLPVLLLAVALSGCSETGTLLATQGAPDSAATPSVSLLVQGSAPPSAVWQVHAPAEATLSSLALWYGPVGVQGGAQLLQAIDPPRPTGSQQLALPPGAWSVLAEARFADGGAAWSLPVRAPAASPSGALLQRFTAGPDQVVVDQDGDGTERVVLAGETQAAPGQALMSVQWSGSAGGLGPGLTHALLLPLGQHAFTLEARYIGDGVERTALDALSVTVVANAPPEAAATEVVQVWDSDGDGKETVRLQGSVRDPGGGNVTAAWMRNGIRLLDRAVGNVTLVVGHHDLVLQVTDEGGRTASAATGVDVWPNRPPVADSGGGLRVRDQDGDGGEAVALDASQSRDPEGGSLAYRWTRGSEQLGNTARLAWVAPLGTHALTLLVTDAGGATSTSTKQVQVLPAAPPFDVVLDAACLGLDCELDASASTGADPFRFTWTVDGTQLEHTTPLLVQTFTPGRHSVQVDVLDDDGRRGSKALQLDVRADLPLSVSSPAFLDGQEIPETYGCRLAGQDGALYQMTALHQMMGIPPPPLRFTLPSNTRFLAFTVVDTVPDFAHWVVWNVAVPPNGVVEIPSGTLPGGAVEGTEDASGNLGYFPICGFTFTGIHPFVFTAYALREPLSLPAGSTRQAMLAAITPDNLVGTATYGGTYENHVCEPAGLGILPGPLAGPVLAQAWGTMGIESNGMSGSCVYTP